MLGIVDGWVSSLARNGQKEGGERGWLVTAAVGGLAVLGVQSDVAVPSRAADRLRKTKGVEEKLQEEIHLAGQDLGRHLWKGQLRRA